MLHEENEKAKSNIVADKYRAAMLRRRLHVLDWKRKKMKHERSLRALVPGEAEKPQKPKKYVLDELQEKYQGCSYNDASKKVSYFSFQPVLHNWCNKGRGMCYPVSGMVHIKEPLLLIDKSSLCGGSGFPFSLSELSLTIRLTPYNRR